jgi:hypothetical protein
VGVQDKTAPKTATPVCFRNNETGKFEEKPVRAVPPEISLYGKSFPGVIAVLAQSPCLGCCPHLSAH